MLSNGSKGNGKVDMEKLENDMFGDVTTAVDGDPSSRWVTTDEVEDDFEKQQSKMDVATNDKIENDNIDMHRLPTTKETQNLLRIMTRLYCHGISQEFRRPVHIMYPEIAIHYLKVFLKHCLLNKNTPIFSFNHSSIHSIQIK